MTKFKFQNTRENRKLLKEAGYLIHDPHSTFNRKAWIIIGDDTLLYGVEKRNYPVILVEDYLKGF